MNELKNNSNSANSKKQGEDVNLPKFQKSSPFFSANSKKIVEKQLKEGYSNKFLKNQSLAEQKSQKYISSKQPDSRKKLLLLKKSRNTFDRKTN